MANKEVRLGTYTVTETAGNAAGYRYIPADWKVYGNGDIKAVYDR